MDSTKIKDEESLDDGAKLTVGDMQHMVFQHDDDPPFYATDVKKYGGTKVVISKRNLDDRQGDGGDKSAAVPDADTVVAGTQTGGRGGKDNETENHQPDAETKSDTRSNDTISQEVDDFLTRSPWLCQITSKILDPESAAGFI